MRQHSTNDFIDAKIASILADVAVNDRLSDYFESTEKRKAFTDEEYDDAIERCQKQEEALHQLL